MEILQEKRALAALSWTLTQLLAFAMGIMYFVVAAGVGHGGEKFAFVWKGLWFWCSIGGTFVLLFRKGTEHAFSMFVIISIFLNQIALVDASAAPGGSKGLSGFGLAYFFVSALSLFGILTAKEEFVDIGPSFDDGGVYGPPPGDGYQGVV
ncbi:MARVEL domain-containing protein [Plasmodiophora brassicae]|uniref:Uncharacterized protein n=2 Tax=Plasmodiophora brassicae TaxID=37360 RepID=A0A3P3YC41_PLABS|nr:unnamed protein product [Plasmodiophora brassicae]